MRECMRISNNTRKEKDEGMTLSSISIDDTWADFVTTKQVEARDALILHYMPLVRFVVSRLGIPPTSMLEMEDLVSYGTIGLMNAIDRYDPERGVRFEAFATARIRGAVIDQLRALNWLPRSAVSRVKQVETTLAILEQRLGRYAQEDEAAKELGVTVERYRHMLVEAGLSMLSLDAPLSMFGQDDELLTLRDLLEDSTTPGPSEVTEQKEMFTMLQDSVERLPEREQLLLSLYYVEELTMKEISRVMDVSESRVCQLHAQALLRLRTLFAEGDIENTPKGVKTTVAGGKGVVSKSRAKKFAS